nr:hypothetical protein [uncultured Butyricicoccus sp.]
MTMYAVLDKLTTVLDVPASLVLDAIIAQLGDYDAACYMSVNQITAVVEAIHYWTI